MKRMITLSGLLIRFLNELEEKHKTIVKNVSKEPQVFPVTDLKCYLSVLPY